VIVRLATLTSKYCQNRIFGWVCSPRRIVLQSRPESDGTSDKKLKIEISHRGLDAGGMIVPRTIRASNRLVVRASAEEPRLARVEALLEMGMFHHLKCTRLYYRPRVNSTAAESSEPRLQSQSPKAAVSKTEERNRSPFAIIS
jgi:hypothetical protein